MGCGLFKATAPRLRLVSDLLPPPHRHSASSRLSSTMRSSPRCPLAVLGRQSQEVPPPRWPRLYPSRPLPPFSPWFPASTRPQIGQHCCHSSSGRGVEVGREAGVVGGPAASVPERSRPRPCLWCPRGGSGERDRPILPTLSAPLAARPPLAPTYPQLRASRLDAEPREETRAVESRSGDRRGARPGRRARR